MSSAVGNAPTQFVPTRSQLNVAYSVCRSIARSAAKNFYYGFAVLPPRKRNALTAVYAFMRRCDDIADDTTLPVEDRKSKLIEWLDKVHRALAGQPTDDPVLLALTDAQRRYEIPIGLLDQLAFGTEADLEDEPSAVGAPLMARYKTFEDLAQVLLRRRVGGGAGLHSHLRISRSGGGSAARSVAAWRSSSRISFAM